MKRKVKRGYGVECVKDDQGYYLLTQDDDVGEKTTIALNSHEASVVLLWLTEELGPAQCEDN